MIIGLTGPNASGKGEAAIYIKSKGFRYHSLSDILRLEAKEQGIDPIRENLIKLGNDLRQKNGPGMLAVRLLENLPTSENHIVDSIRNPQEAKELYKIGEFFMIGIDAPVELRFKRSLRRKRPGDASTLQEFIEKEEKENRNTAENQQLKSCLKMADVVIVNDTNIEDFRSKINEAIKKHKNKKA